MQIPSPLALVHCTVLRVDERLAGLSHVADLLTALLDASPFWSLVNAAASGSLRLFDRVAFRVLKDPTTNPHVLTSWLAQALKAAIQHDDLAIAQRIHSLHPEPLDVRSLRHALVHGTLKTVQWVVENRHDCLCCPAGVRNLCRGCLRLAVSYCDLDELEDPAKTCLHDPLVLPWLFQAGIILDPRHNTDRGLMCCAARKNREVAKWCDDNQVFTVKMVQQVLFDVIAYGPPGSIPVLDFLLARGYSIPEDRVITAMLFSVRKYDMAPMLEAVVASRLCDTFRDKFQYAPYTEGGAKVLQWEAVFMDIYRLETYVCIPGVLSNITTDYQNLDQITWMYYKRGVRPFFSSPPRSLSESSLIGLLEWLNAIGVEPMPSMLLSALAENGQLQVVRWIYNKSCRGELELGNSTWNSAVLSAAETGHLHVIRWIHEEGIRYSALGALEKAAARGQFEVVRWMLSSSELDTTTAMLNAAHSGHTDILVWLFLHSNATCTARMCRKLILFYDPHQPVPSLCRTSLRWLNSTKSRCADEENIIPSVGTPQLAIMSAYCGCLQLLKELTTCLRNESIAIDPTYLVTEAEEEEHRGLVDWLTQPQHS